MTRFKQDLRYAMRHVMRSPGFALSAIVTLAIGVGANLTVFLILYGVILRPLPFAHPEQLARVARFYAGEGDSPAYSATKFLYFERANRSLESMAGYDYFPHSVNVFERNAIVPLQALGVTSQFFHVFQMEPELGRGFSREDMVPHSAGVAVLSDATWRHQFGADPGILGRGITLGNMKYTVVGVANPKFHLASKVDVWLPLQFAEDANDHDNMYNVVARLRPGVTAAMAQEDLRRVLREMRQIYPGLSGDDESVHVWDYHESLVGDVKPALKILMGAVGLLLVIVSANILSLLMTRSIARRREMSVRVALGATGARLMQQMLVENLLLCALGACTGALLAQFVVPILLHLSPIQLPDFAVLNIGAAGVCFAAVLAVGCALLFSMVPAFEAGRARLNESLRMNPTQVAVGKLPAQRVLVIGEVAMSLVLLVVAALLLSSFWKLVHISPGFDAQNVITFRTAFSDQETQESGQFGQLLDRLAARAEALPGVQSAGAAMNVPMQILPDLPFDIAGHPQPNGDPIGDKNYVPITAHYFDALKIPVLAGRAFTDADRKGSAPVLIVNHAFAQEFFPNEDPLGQHILIGRAMGPEFADQVREIVGVVGDTKQDGLDQPTPGMMFLPSGQVPDRITQKDNRVLGMSWLIRTKPGGSDVANELRTMFLEADQVPVSGMTTMQQVMSDSVAQQRFNMVLLSGFGVIALLLGAAGLYGVMSYTVARQTKEIGVRMALGAARSDIIRMVLSEAGWLVGNGIVIGAAASIAGGKLLAGILFGVRARDPLTLVGVCAVLMATGLASAWWPARRAASVEPMKALRIE